jgi:RNase P subunit RPR2
MALHEAKPAELLVYANPSAETLAMRLRSGIYRYEAEGLYKRCGHCKEYWPADSEFFYCQSQQRDGLMCWCKACYVDTRYPQGRSKKQQERLCA